MGEEENGGQLKTTWKLKDYEVLLILRLNPYAPLAISMCIPNSSCVSGYCKNDTSTIFTHRNVEGFTFTFKCENIPNCILIWPIVWNKIPKVELKNKKNLHFKTQYKSIHKFVQKKTIFK